VDDALRRLPRAPRTTPPAGASIPSPSPCDRVGTPIRRPACRASLVDPCRVPTSGYANNAPGADYSNDTPLTSTPQACVTHDRQGSQRKSTSVGILTQTYALNLDAAAGLREKAERARRRWFARRSAYRRVDCPQPRAAIPRGHKGLPLPPDRSATWQAKSLLTSPRCCLRSPARTGPGSAAARW